MRTPLYKTSSAGDYNINQPVTEILFEPGLPAGTGKGGGCCRKAGRKIGWTHCAAISHFPGHGAR
jgi:hypothetical protein